MDQAYDDLYIKYEDQKAIAEAVKGSLVTALNEVAKLRKNQKCATCVNPIKRTW